MASAATICILFDKEFMRISTECGASSNERVQIVLWWMYPEFVHRGPAVVQSLNRKCPITRSDLEISWITVVPPNWFSYEFTIGHAQVQVSDLSSAQSPHFNWNRSGRQSSLEICSAIRLNSASLTESKNFMVKEEQIRSCVCATWDWNSSELSSQYQ